MTHIDQLIKENVENYAAGLMLSGGTAVIEPWAINGTTWIVALSGVATHSLTSTDLSSAQDESDAWFLSNDHKRISVWYGGDGYQCIVAL
jgi:hypothetical protein